MPWSPEISRSVVPPGGYHYLQPLGDGSYSRIEGGSYDHLVDLILRYRLANGILLPPECAATPEGVHSDYNAWACRQWPWLCTAHREAPPATIESASGLSGFEMLLARAQRWVDWARTRPLDWVDQKRAHDRALVCQGCPQNVYWETNCSACNTNLTLSVRALKGARRTGLEDALRGCRAFGTIQELAVWLAQPGGDSKYPAPAACWRLRG